MGPGALARGPGTTLQQLKLCFPGALHPAVPVPLRQRMVAFLAALHRGTNTERSFGAAGGPWDFNLRDLLRWCQLAEATPPPGLAATPDGAAQVRLSRHATAALNQTGSLPRCSLSPSVYGISWLQPFLHHRGCLHYRRHLVQRGKEFASPHARPSHPQAIETAAEHYVHILVVQRLRTTADRAAATAAFEQTWGRPLAPLVRCVPVPASCKRLSSARQTMLTALLPLACSFGKHLPKACWPSYAAGPPVGGGQPAHGAHRAGAAAADRGA